VKFKFTIGEERWTRNGAECLSRMDIFVFDNVLQCMLLVF